VDLPAGRRRWRTLPILIAGLLVVAVLATLLQAPALARTRVDAMLGALAGWLWETSWAWPLAAALALMALISPQACRRWPRPVRRALPAIATFLGLVGLASLATVSRPRVGLLVAGVVVVTGLLATWVLVVPRRLAPPVPVPAEGLDSLGDRDRLEVADARVKLQNDLRTTALQAVTVLAVLAGAVLAFQQLTEDRRQANATRELTVQGQASERFTRAIDQLGSERREVQLGGIYGLEQIAQLAPRDSRLAVTEVLVAYLHRRTPRPTRPPSRKNSFEELRLRASDVQAALTVLGRRRHEPTDPRLDLRALDLRRADLNEAQLSGALFGETDLSGADLRGAELGGADLNRADLRAALLNGANLRAALLTGADLSMAGLYGADLGGAMLHGAHLGYALLSNANLSGANLTAANLGGADLIGADLRGANLRGANLRGAKLGGATADQSTTWPDRFDWRGAGVR
jgi:uncharacterized protein YjbI with pentapeptide repeats